MDYNKLKAREGKRKAREDTFRKALVSLYKEVESIPRDHSTKKLKFQRFFLDKRVSALGPPTDEIQENITTILTNLKENEDPPDPIPDSTCVTVRNVPRDELREKVERAIDEMTDCISQGMDFSFEFPDRSDDCQFFDKEKELMVLKKGPTTKRFFRADIMRTDKAALSMLYALEKIYKYCIDGTFFTKRDFYYDYKTHFTSQNQSNVILEDVCLYLLCTMGSIGVCPNSRGAVIGDLKLIYEDRSEINCAEFCISGHSIPHSMDQVTSIESKSALAVLLVEKQTVFVQLSQKKFHDRFRCIMVTAKGYGDIATRLLLRRIQKELKLPIFGLTDFDPHGLEILSVYRYGSKNMSFDCRSLVIPNIRWIGILSTDKEKFSIPDRCSMDMSATSIKKGKSIAESGYMKKNKKWRNELDIMNTSKKTTGIEALKSIDDDHLVHKYLPEKLQLKDWLL